MKKILFHLVILCLASNLPAQTYKIVWGDDIKLKKGTADLDIVGADNTGLYLTEAHLKMKSPFAIGGGYGTSYTLYKVDKNFNQVFDKEYKKELKGLDFNSFQFLENDLFLFATDYIKKEKLFKVYGAKVDKNSGELLGDPIELGSYPLESKRDDYDMKMTTIQNGKSFLMVTNISGEDRVSLGISILDKNFNKKENTVINLTIDPKHYSLQDVRLTASNKIILWGKEYEETQVGKKKRKKLVFKQYLMSIYNIKGSKESDVNLNSGDKFVISGRLIESPKGELLLGGFYSNTAKKDDLNGFFINKIDPDKGALTLSSYKEINASMLGRSFADATDEDEEIKENKKQAQKAKDDDDDDELPNNFTIKSVDISPSDNSIIITSEVSQYSSYSYTTSEYNNVTKNWTNTTHYVHRFLNQDILVIDADENGNIKWLNDLPKSQLEEVRSSFNSQTASGIYFPYDYSAFFASSGGMPYYSSYVSLIENNHLVILMNDHSSNNVNAEYGDKVKTVSNFKKKSNTYGVSIDLASGKMTRKIVSANNEDAILMPRHAMVINNDVFIPSWRQHAMAKTELKFAKITVH